MSLITLQTTFTKNTSLQKGDIIYYLDKDINYFNCFKYDIIDNKYKLN